MQTPAHAVLDALIAAANNGDREAAMFLPLFCDWLVGRIQDAKRDAMPS